MRIVRNSVKTDIRRLESALYPEDNATCWSYTACLSIALLRRRSRLPRQVHFRLSKATTDQKNAQAEVWTTYYC